LELVDVLTGTSDRHRGHGGQTEPSQQKFLVCLHLVATKSRAGTRSQTGGNIGETATGFAHISRVEILSHADDAH